MSIEQSQTVDFVTVDKESGDLRLTISDHLPWDSEEGEHLLLLQDKLNAYLGFIESGELVQKFPVARGRKVVINVVGKFPLSKEAEKYYNLAGSGIREAGFELEFEYMPI